MMALDGIEEAIQPDHGGIDAEGGEERVVILWLRQLRACDWTRP
jgi:hypothetical protein